MSPGLALYRGVTWSLGLLLPHAAALGRQGSVWRGSLTGASPEAFGAAGSIWVHAASMGEVGAAERWIEALIGSGVRPPLLLTTRTRSGLGRARRELEGRALARIAPADFPQTTRSLLDAAAPSRIDIVETEMWPNLILEAHRSNVGVVFVSGTVSDRTTRRLRALGMAGAPLFGGGVFALTQDQEAAARFRALGIPPERVRVAGDLKSDIQVEANPAPEGDRVAVVFGSLRPGEEGVALLLAQSLDLLEPSVAHPVRPILVVAPRHPDGAALARRSFHEAGYALIERAEKDRDGPLAPWMERAARQPGRRVALLTTQGELADAYAHARAAVIGGTFAPFGGHNPLEAAARGCPVVIGPHHESIAAKAASLEREGGAVLARDAEGAAVTVLLWCRDGGFADRSAAALRAAGAGGGAARRGLEALAEWGLLP